MNKNSTKFMADFAGNLWRNFFQSRVEEKLVKYVSYFRATVVSNDNPDNNILRVQRPFDTPFDVRCTNAVKRAEQGDQVLVLQFGKNAAVSRVAVSDGRLTGFDDPYYAGVMNAVTKEISLPVTAEMAPGWSLSTDGISAKLVGNILRLSIAVDSESTIQPGDFSNKKICTVNITHGGRITKHSNAGNNTSFTGGLAAFYTSGSRVDSTTLSFDFKMSSLAIEGSSWSCYMLFPVSINPEKYL